LAAGTKMYQMKNPVNAYALTGFLIFGAAGRTKFAAKNKALIRNDFSHFSRRFFVKIVGL
jgi:hypothetical protein